MYLLHLYSNLDDLNDIKIYFSGGKVWGEGGGGVDIQGARTLKPMPGPEMGSGVSHQNTIL